MAERGRLVHQTCQVSRHSDLYLCTPQKCMEAQPLFKIWEGDLEIFHHLLEWCDVFFSVCCCNSKRMFFKSATFNIVNRQKILTVIIIVCLNKSILIFYIILYSIYKWISRSTNKTSTIMKHAGLFTITVPT